METQEQTAPRGLGLTLDLEIPENTVKKLKAYAMLSGSTIEELKAELVAQVQPKLAEHFNNTLTRGIAEALARMDGRPFDLASFGEEPHRDQNAEIAQREHSLSGDDLEEETPLDLSQPQVAPLNPAGKVPAKQLPVHATPVIQVDKDGDPIFNFNINVPDAGEDAEAFVEESMRGEQSRQTAQGMLSKGVVYGGERASSAKVAFVKPRVKISEAKFNEDDEEEGTRWTQ